VTRKYGAGGDVEEVRYAVALDYLGRNDGGQEIYQCDRVLKLGRGGYYYPSLEGMTYAYNGDVYSGENFGVPVNNLLDMVDGRGDSVEVEEAYLIYELFLRFHEMNNLFVSKSSPPGSGTTDIYLERIGDELHHLNDRYTETLYFGDELGENTYVDWRAVKLKFLGLGKGIEGSAQGIVGTSFYENESHLQFKNGASFDRSRLVREGIININLDSTWVDSSLDREASSIYRLSTSGRTSGTRYTEVKETEIGIAGPDGPRVQ